MNFLNIFGLNESLPDSLRKQIDDYLCSNENITEEYFNSYINKYPDSDYLNGMKAYFLCFNDAGSSASKFIDNVAKKYPKLEKGTFFNLSKACISNKVGNKSNYEKFLQISLKYDQRKINKWLRLELYYLYEQMDFEKSVYFLKEAIKIDKYFTTAQIENCNILHAARRYNEAINVCDLILSKYPNYIYAYTHKGDILLELKKYEEAKNNYDLALKIDTASVDALTGIGNYFYYGLTQHENAFQYYHKAIELDSLNVVALKKMGSLLLDNGDYNKAEEFLSKSYSLLSDYENTTELIYVKLLLKKYKEALVLVEKGKIHYRDKRLILFELLTYHYLGDENKRNSLKKEYFNVLSVEDRLWINEQLNDWKTSF